MPLTDSFSKNLFNGIKLRMNKAFQNPYRAVNINWFSLKYLKHISKDKMYSHKLLNHDTFFYSGPEYLHALKEIFIDGVYKQKLPENAYILDCGANIGISVIYLKSICPTANIISFEPDHKNFKLLLKNISSHQITKVEAKNEAVWTEDTTLNFIEEGTMGSKIGDAVSSNTVSVKAVRLKDFLGRKVDFLKLDIEGAEYKVLKDIAENLGNVNRMFLEYHGTFAQNNELLEILELVTEAGFKFYIKEADSVYDLPFLPKKHLSEYDLQLNIFCFR